MQALAASFNDSSSSLGKLSQSANPEVEDDEPSWGGDSASSFAHAADFLTWEANTVCSSSSRMRLQMGVPVWARSNLRGCRQDALGQMSAENLQSFLNESSGSEIIITTRDDNGADGFENVSNAQDLEQYRIMAHHEAWQLVKENLSYDPMERLQEKQKVKEAYIESFTRNGKKERKLIPLPPMSRPKVAPDVFQKSPCHHQVGSGNLPSARKKRSCAQVKLLRISLKPWSVGNSTWFCVWDAECTWSFPARQQWFTAPVARPLVLQPLLRVEFTTTRGVYTFHNFIPETGAFSRPLLLCASSTITRCNKKDDAILNNPSTTYLIHLFQWPVESVLSIHVLTILARLVLGSCPSRRRLMIIVYLGALGCPKRPCKPQQLLHLLFFVQSLQLFLIDFYDSILRTQWLSSSGSFFLLENGRLFLLFLFHFGTQSRHAGASVFLILLLCHIRRSTSRAISTTTTAGVLCRVRCPVRRSIRCSSRIIAR